MIRGFAARWRILCRVELSGIDRAIVCRSRNCAISRRVEQELTLQRTELQIILDMVLALIFYKNRESRFVRVNRQLAQLVGLPAEEFVGKSDANLGSEFADRYREDDLRVMASGQPVLQREEPLYTSSGERWLLTDKVPYRDETGQITGQIGLSVDITERKQIEESLRESQTMLELVLDSIPQGVFWKDRNLVFLGENRVARCAMDLDTPKSIIGRTDFETSSLSCEQAEFYIRTDGEVMDSDRSGFGIKETMTLTDGSTIWLETNKMPVHDAAGNVTGILRTWQDITARKYAEDELRASRERLQVLSRQLLNSQETERWHIARELHDQVGQSLTAIKLNLKSLRPPDYETSALTILEETIAVVDQTLEQVRTLSLDLRPSILDDLGLVVALRWYLDRQARRTGFTVQFATEPSDSGVSKKIETTCFRVVQEIVTNIARHAHTQKVLVELRLLDTELELFIQDDGVGFDLSAARERATQGTSMGLLGMQEQVLILGGRLDIQTAPSRETEIRFCFPLMFTALGSEPPELEE